MKRIKKTVLMFALALSLTFTLVLSTTNPTTAYASTMGGTGTTTYVYEEFTAKVSYQIIIGDDGTQMKFITNVYGVKSTTLSLEVVGVTWNGTTARVYMRHRQTGRTVTFYFYNTDL